MCFLRAIVYVYQIQHNKWLLVMQQILSSIIFIKVNRLNSITYQVCLFKLLDFAMP